MKCSKYVSPSRILASRFVLTVLKQVGRWKVDYICMPLWNPGLSIFALTILQHVGFCKV